MTLFLRRVAALVVIAFTVTLVPAFAQNDIGDGDNLTPNFKDVDIRQVIETVSDVTGQNFLIDARVKGNVTMISDTGMSREDFYETFLSILQIYGFVAVPSGNVVKIIPDTNARQFPVPTGATGAGGDDIVTEVVSVTNVGAAQLVPILRPLVPQYGHLAAHPASNMLIIADRAANVARLKKIIRRIDQSSDEGIEVIPMEHASANEIVRILQTLSQTTARGDASSQPLGLVADERTNSVLLSGEKGKRLRFRTLIAHLDTPLEEGGNTQVIYLHYANAEELATKLNEQVRGAAPSAGGTQGSAQAASGAQNNIVIWSDADTNALIITAPPKVMRNLRMVIDKIDIRRAQVHVEAMLVEVLGNNDANLGVSWVLDGSDKGPALATSDLAGTISTLSVAGSVAGGDVTAAGTALAGQGLAIGIGRFRDEGTNFGAILSALRSHGTTNILSTPSIVTMDNEEAEVNIGEEVPFLTGSFTNTGGGNAGAVNPFNTIQREDVGIKLKITPQINEGDAVIMNIELEASSVNETTGNAVDLRTSQRQFTQRVIVDDGGVIVLGGLIDDSVVENEARVPILSRIPILGAAFRARTTNVEKRNLMVFIRPKIIRDGTDAAIETNSKYNYIRDLQLGRDRDVQLIPNLPRPIIPTIEDARENGFIREEAIDLRNRVEEAESP